MSRKIRAIVVDDEPLAREGLTSRLTLNCHVEVVAECSSAKHAINAVQSQQPNVVFLDIEMPGMNGLELAKHLQGTTEHCLKIVFVTAFREFALNAFEFKAFDYLLKPFADERLAQCIDNLVAHFDENQVLEQHRKLGQLLNRKTGNSIDGLMQNLQVCSGTSLVDLQQTISLKDGSEWLRVKLDSIAWIEAAGDYMCVHTTDGTHIIRKTLKQFEQELDPIHFPRVNRSAMVNINKLQKLSPNSNGEYFAQLSTGDKVKVSRKYKFRLDELKRI